MMKRILLIIILVLLPSMVQAQSRYGATLDSLRMAVRDVLGEVNEVRFPDSVLTTFVNEAQMRVAIDCGAYRKKDTLIADDGVAFYASNSDAIEGWPVDVLAYRSDQSDVKSRWFGLRWLLPKDWVTSTDEDRPAFFSGYVAAGEIALYPPPSDSGWAIYVYYRALPTDLTLDTMHTQVPRTDRPAVVAYAAKRAAESVGWDVMGALQTAEYDRHVGARMLDMVAPRYDIKGKDQQGVIIQ